MIEKVLYELNLYLQNLKSYVKLKHSNRQKAPMWVYISLKLLL